MKKKRPSFPFFGSDYLGSGFVNELEKDEEWAYMRCLIVCGDSGSIPSDLKGISKVFRNLCTLREARALWGRIAHRFEPHPTEPGRLINRRMEDAKESVDKFRQKQADNSKKRWLPKGEKEPPKTPPESSQAASQSHPKPHPKPISKVSQAVSQTVSQPPSQSDPSISISNSLLSREDKSNIQDFVRPIGPETGERTNHKNPELLRKLWAPVEGYIRKTVTEDAFGEFYEGCQLVELSYREVTLGVPSRLLTAKGSVAFATAILAQIIEDSGSDLLRGRALKVIPLEHVGEA